MADIQEPVTKDDSPQVIGDEFDLLGQNTKSSQKKDDTSNEPPKRGDAGDWL